MQRIHNIYSINSRENQSQSVGNKRKVKPGTAAAAFVSDHKQKSNSNL